MKVISKLSSPLSVFEVYEIVAKELSKIPQNHQQNELEFKRKFCYLSVLEYVGRFSAVPSIDALEFETPEEKNVFQSYGLIPAVVTTRKNLDSLLVKLHSDFGLSQAELLSVADLAPTELVDFYAIIEQCGTRFQEHEVAEMLNASREAFTLAAKNSIQSAD